MGRLRGWCGTIDEAMDRCLPETNSMIALDTNVLIYCCDRRDPRRQKIAMDLVADTTEGARLYSEDLPGRTRV